MNIEEQKAYLVKKRSMYLRLFMITTIIGIVSFGTSLVIKKAIFEYVGYAGLFAGIISFTMAYRTGFKYINLD